MAANVSYDGTIKFCSSTNPKPFHSLNQQHQNNSEKESSIDERKSGSAEPAPKHFQCTVYDAVSPKRIQCTNAIGNKYVQSTVNAFAELIEKREFLTENAASIQQLTNNAAVSTFDV